MLKLLMILAALGLLVAACDDDTDVAGTEEGETYNWQLAETHVEDFPITEADRWFADEVSGRTDGRIDIDVFPDSQLGEEADVLEQVQLGAIEMTRVSASPVSEFQPDWGVFSLPYIWDDEDHMYRFLESDTGQQLLEDLREANFYGLAYFHEPARHFYTTGQPIEHPDDLQGLNIRVQPGGVNVDMIEAMGGSATTMDFGEVYSALESGVIDGAENTEPSYVSTSHYEVAPYYTLDGHTQVPNVLLIAEDVWDDVSEEDQEILLEVAEEANEVLRELYADEVEESLATIEEAGNDIIEVDIEPFQESVQPLLEDMRDQFGDLLDAIEEVR